MKRSKISLPVVFVAAAAVVLGCSGGNSKGSGDTRSTTSAPAEVTLSTLPAPAGAAFTTAINVSESNTVVGWSGGTAGARAVTWPLTGGQVPAAPTEHLPIEGNFDSAAYSSNGGLVVGESRKGASNVAVAWVNGSATPTELSLAGFAPPAVAFASAGSHIVGQATLDNLIVAVLWTSVNAAPVELGGLDSDGTSRAYAISPSGVIVGEATDNGANRGAVWEVDAEGDLRDGPDPLDPLPGDVGSAAFSVSGEVIVGESQAANGSVRAVRWTRSAGGNISPPVELDSGSAYGVSGTFAVGVATGQAKLWDLADLTQSAVLAPAPSQALGINAAGTIVGFQGKQAFVALSEEAGPATGVTLFPSVASPQPAGTAVTFTAQGLGSTLPYQYRFWLYRNGGWEVVQDYSAVNTWTLPDTTSAGTYDVSVHVRTSDTVDFDAVLNPPLSYTLAAANADPASGVTLSADLESPQVVGTPITFTAQGEGSVLPYQYRFWLYRNGTWEIVQDYSADSTWTLPDTTAAGTYDVSVHVRTSDGVDYDAVLNPSMTYRLSSTGAGPATGVTMDANLASPQAAGTAVTFTAQGEGSTGTYQYRFWLYRNGAWEIAQDWGLSNTWVLPAGLTAGVYDVSVHVRTDPSGPAEAMLNPSQTYVLF